MSAGKKGLKSDQDEKQASPSEKRSFASFIGGSVVAGASWIARGAIRMINAFIAEIFALASGLAQLLGFSLPAQSSQGSESPASREPASPEAEAKGILERDLKMRIVVVGNTGSGKTALRERYINGKAPEPTHTPTTGVDSVLRKHEINGGETTLKLQIWDTAGQEEFQSITRGYYSKAEAAMVVYDANTSMADIRKWVAALREKSPNIVIMLVDSQNPVAESKGTASKGATLEEIEAFMKETGNEGLMRRKANAKTGEGVDAAFEGLAGAVLKKRHPGAKVEFSESQAPAAEEKKAETQRGIEPVADPDRVRSFSLASPSLEPAFGSSEAVGMTLRRMSISTPVAGKASAQPPSSSGGQDSVGSFPTS